jgi:hypothetical protein
VESGGDTTSEGGAWNQFKIGQLYNRNGEYATGIPILKEIVANESLSSKLRVEALITMVGPYYNGRLQEPLELIFADDASLYKEALGTGNANDPDDLQIALRRLLERGDSLYPMSYIKYSIALWYSGQLIDNNALTKEERDSYQLALLELLAEGNGLRDIEIRSNDFRSPNLIYDLYFVAQNFKFYNLTILARLDKSYVGSVESAWNTLMSEYDRIQDLSTAQKLVQSYTRFYYAAFLADIYGSAKQEEIISVMSPIALGIGDFANSNQFLLPFFEKELTRPQVERGHNEKFILAVASLDVDFKNLLESKGWLGWK